MQQQTSTLADHLKELKYRAFTVIGFFATASILGWVLYPKLIHIIQKPLGETLYYTSPAGGLGFILQVSLAFGFVITLPLLIYQTAQFIRPTLTVVKTRAIVWFTFISLLLSILGLAYAYFVSLPAALKFLVGFNNDSLRPLIGAKDYMQFIAAYAIGAIITFQLPLIFWFANKVRRFPPGGLFRAQRPVVVGIAIVSGVITPTIDPINQLAIALPMLLLFELGVSAVFIRNLKKPQAVPQSASDMIIAPEILDELTTEPDETILGQNAQVPRGIYMDII